MSTTAAIDSILARACAAVGLAAQEAKPIRLGENAIFRLPDGVVARVSQPGQQRAAQREVAVSHWLNASGVAAVVPLAGIDQPVEIAERSVTFWEELPAHHHGSPAEVARMLKRLHSLSVPTNVPLCRLDPFVRLSERIDGATTVVDEDRAWLRKKLAKLQDQWVSTIAELPTCVVHGDAWAGNVVTTDDGRVVLLDLERCSIGPREWDLVSTAVKHVTYGQLDQAQYQQFCDTYGSDVVTWSGFAVLRDIRELRMTCYVAQQAANEPRFEHEARLRIDCLRGRRGPRPWPWTPAE